MTAPGWEKGIADVSALASSLRSNAVGLAVMASTDLGREELRRSITEFRQFQALFQQAGRELGKTADVMSVQLRKKRPGVHA